MCRADISSFRLSAVPMLASSPTLFTERVACGFQRWPNGLSTDYWFLYKSISHNSYMYLIVCPSNLSMYLEQLITDNPWSQSVSPCHPSWASPLPTTVPPPPTHDPSPKFYDTHVRRPWGYNLEQIFRVFFTLGLGTSGLICPTNNVGGPCQALGAYWREEWRQGSTRQTPHQPATMWPISPGGGYNGKTSNFKCNSVISMVHFSCKLANLFPNSVMLKIFF